MPDGKPIDSAYVKVTMDFTDADREVQRGVEDSLGELRPLVADLVESVERNFREMTAVIQDSFQDLAHDLTLDLERIAEATDRTANTLETQFREGANAAGRQFDQLASGAIRDLDRIETKADTASHGISGSFKGLLLGGALVGGLYAAASGLEQLTTFGLKSAANLEQVQIQFNALTGSVQKGQVVFKQLQDFAAATPFEFKDLTTTTARFLAMADTVGLAKNQLVPFLTTLGDVVSVTGGGAQNLDSVSLALSQIASRGKLTLDNLNQLSNALPGFSGVAAIAAATGKTQAQVMDEITAGSISAGDGIKYLLQGMQQFPGAAGAMAAQSQTLAGVFSTFSDTISQALSNAFLPVIPSIKDALTQITPILGDALNQVAPAIGQVLAGLLPLAGKLVSALVPILTPLLDALAPALAGLGDALGPLGAALGQLVTAAAPILPVVSSLIGSLVSGLSPILSALTPGIEALVGAIGDIAVSLGPVLEQLGGQLGALLVPLVNQLALAFQALGPAIEGLLPVLVQLVQPLLGALVEILPQLLQAFQPMIPAWVQLAPAIAQVAIALTPLVELLAQLLVLVAPFLADAIRFASVIASWLLLHGVVDYLNGFAQAITDVRTHFGDVIQFFEDLPGTIWNAITALPGLVQQVFAEAFDAAFYAVGFGITKIVQEVVALPGQLVTAIAWFNTELPALVGRGLMKAGDAIKGWVDSAVNWLTGLPGRAASAVAGLWPAVKNAWGDVLGLSVKLGEDIINGIVQGVKNGAGMIADAAKRAAKDALDGAKHALGISSPSKEFAKLGAYSMQGFARGVEGGTADAAAATSSAFDSLLGGTVTNSTTSSVSPAIQFGPGSINVTLGAGATPQAAYAAGQQVAAGILAGMSPEAFATYRGDRVL